MSAKIDYFENTSFNNIKYELEFFIIIAFLFSGVENINRTQQYNVSHLKCVFCPMCEAFCTTESFYESKYGNTFNKIVIVSGCHAIFCHLNHPTMFV